MTTIPHPTRPGCGLLPFNLDAAKAGIEVCTSTGSPVRIYAFDHAEDYPIVGALGKPTRVQTWTNEGKTLVNNPTCSDNLRLVLPDPGEGYRLLDAGETAKGCDCYAGGKWFPNSMSVTQFKGGNIYRVRVEPVTDSGATMITYSQGASDAATIARLKARIEECDATIFRLTEHIAQMPTQAVALGIERATQTTSVVPTPSPDADDWIPWSGGDCPVPGDTVVEVKLHGGALDKAPAGDYRWTHNAISGDIIAYRIHKSAPAAGAATAPQAESSAIDKPGFPSMDARKEWERARVKEMLAEAAAGAPITIADVDERIARAFAVMANDADVSSWLQKSCSYVAAKLREEAKP